MNDRLDSQHIVMPVGEEEDDTTVLMLQGAYRGDIHLHYLQYQQSCSTYKTIFSPLYLPIEVTYVFHQIIE